MEKDKPMTVEELQTIVPQLLEKQNEGAYWDFKEAWYESNEKGKSDLLHDIICMANNLTSKDGLIIIGIQDNTYNVTGVEKDTHRRTTQMLVDFLSRKAFAGGVRPSVYVHTISLEGHDIDVLVVENTRQTPYYLTHNEGKNRAQYIYTRIVDSNTAVDQSADPHYTEMLWRKRFRIDAPPLEKAKEYLQDVDGWKISPVDNQDVKYYEAAPEYTMTAELDPSRNGLSVFLLETVVGIPEKLEFIKFRYREVTLKYHQTTLYVDLLVGIDNNHMEVIVPHREYFRITEKTYVLFYLTKGSLSYLINNHYSTGSLSDYYLQELYYRDIITFENDQERVSFIEYMQGEMLAFEGRLKSSCLDISLAVTNATDDCIEQYKGAVLFKIMYNEWKEQTYAGEMHKCIERAL